MSKSGQKSGQKWSAKWPKSLKSDSNQSKIEHCNKNTKTLS